jgi:hypothetical protein
MFYSIDKRRCNLVKYSTIQLSLIRVLRRGVSEDSQHVPQNLKCPRKRDISNEPSACRVGFKRSYGFFEHDGLKEFGLTTTECGIAGFEWWVEVDERTTARICMSAGLSIYHPGKFAQTTALIE